MKADRDQVVDWAKGMGLDVTMVRKFIVEVDDLFRGLNDQQRRHGLQRLPASSIVGHVFGDKHLEAHRRLRVERLATMDALLSKVKEINFEQVRQGEGFVVLA